MLVTLPRHINQNAGISTETRADSLKSILHRITAQMGCLEVCLLGRVCLAVDVHHIPVSELLQQRQVLPQKRQFPLFAFDCQVPAQQTALRIYDPQIQTGKSAKQVFLPRLAQLRICMQPQVLHCQQWVGSHASRLSCCLILNKNFSLFQC